MLIPIHTSPYNTAKSGTSPPIRCCSSIREVDKSSLSVFRYKMKSAVLRWKWSSRLHSNESDSKVKEVEQEDERDM